MELDQPLERVGVVTDVGVRQRLRSVNWRVASAPKPVAATVGLLIPVMTMRALARIPEVGRQIPGAVTLLLDLFIAVDLDDRWSMSHLAEVAQLLHRQHGDVKEDRLAAVMIVRRPR